MRGDFGNVQISCKMLGDIVHGPHDPLVHRGLFVFGIDGVAPEEHLLQKVHQHLVPQFPCGPAHGRALFKQGGDGALQFFRDDKPHRAGENLGPVEQCGLPSRSRHKSAKISNPLLALEILPVIAGCAGFDEQ
jgi:hypothetical protein